MIPSPKNAASKAQVNSTKIADMFDDDNTTTENLSLVDKSATDYSALETTNKKEASSLMISRISDGINRNLVINDSVEQTSDGETELSSLPVIENSEVLEGSSIQQNPVKRGAKKLIESSEESRPESTVHSNDDDSVQEDDQSQTEYVEIHGESSVFESNRVKPRPKVLDISQEDEPAVIDITLNDSPKRQTHKDAAGHKLTNGGQSSKKNLADDIILLSDSEDSKPSKKPQNSFIDSPVVQPKPSEAYSSPNMFSRKLNDQKPVASWSPNYEQVKAKVQKTIKENQPRKIQMIDITKNEFNQAPPATGDDDDVNSIDRLKNLNFQANVIRNGNDAQISRHYSYEHQLKELSEQMIGVLEEKPNPDEIDDDYVASEEAKSLIPKGLKVNLLNHQLYSLKWLKWREQTYPYGGILADDMGLGKTLTILSYLKLMKDRREDAMKAKLEDLNQEDDEDVDDDEREIRRKRFEKKYSSRRALSKPLKTLIILPASLIHQWEGEIKNRFERDTFKYLAYHGNNRNKFSYNLDDYDIVFTTYELVSREVALVDKQGNDVKVSVSIYQS